MIGLRAVLVLAMILLAQNTLGAEEASSTIKSIKERGKILLGVREAAPPFSFHVGNQRFVGFSVDLMMRVVAELKIQLDLPGLEYQLVPFTSQNGISLLQMGQMDLECSATSNTVDRQQQVAFSTNFFESSTKLLTATSSDIQGFGDLTGKRISTTAGTTADHLLQQYKYRNALDFTIITARENTQAFRMLESERVDAYMMDEAILFAEKASAQDPSRWTVVGEPFSTERYACMMRKSDQQLKSLVDRTLNDLMKSGEINVYYDKWFNQPIPLKNISLNRPMPSELKSLYAHPSDSPVELSPPLAPALGRP